MTQNIEGESLYEFLSNILKEVVYRIILTLFCLKRTEATMVVPRLGFKARAHMIFSK